jgi:hypothetical protein
MKEQEPPSPEPLLFVDAIEEGRARLLLDEDAFTVPTSLLPAGARAGSWLSLSLRVVPAPPSRADAIRRKLARDDDGGPIKL